MGRLAPIFRGAAVILTAVLALSPPGGAVRADDSVQPPVVADTASTGVPSADVSSVDIPSAEANSTASTPTYEQYRRTDPDARGTAFSVEAAAYSDFTGTEPQPLTGYAGDEGMSLLLSEEGGVSYALSVPATGWYTIAVEYCPYPGSGAGALRDILLDGALPFAEAAELAFERRWVDVPADRTDIYGNQLRPLQQEEAAWMKKTITDAAGKVDGPLCWYLTAGAHTLEVAARREPMAVKRFRFEPAEPVPSYEAVLAQWRGQGYREAESADAFSWEAEQILAKSDQSILPVADRSSPTVTPYEPGSVVYNAVGGGQWKTAGQWVEWEVDVRQGGLYQIGLHFRQNSKSDAASVRRLTIDGELPFAEAASLRFAYAGQWQSAFLSDPKGDPYLFYLPEGLHTLRLEAALGDFREVLVEADACTAELNRLYREIVVVSGTSPDKYRDYAFEKMIPGTLADMETLSDRLRGLERLVRAVGFSGNQGTNTIKRLYAQLDYMTDDPSEIAQRLETFRDIISALGTWRNELSEQPLAVDRLTLAAPGTELEKGEAGFFGLLIHNVRLFGYSFVRDYNAIGTTTADTADPLTVWLMSGRDQAQILKQLTSDRFTPQTNTGVSLQLVGSDALLPALLAGTGPDVALGLLQASSAGTGTAAALAQTDPMNLALRNALVDLSTLPGYAEVAERFGDGATAPFSLDGGVYALPETQSFPMLFYRRDILESLGVTDEDLETWDGLLKKAMPAIQKNSLTIGITANLGSYLTLLYQYGGSLYDENLEASKLNGATAIRAMEDYAKLYTQYRLPLAFDFANRFRSGEMPVGIADFTMVNQLTVFAPDIKGLWGMLPVPGTKREDGSVSHATAFSVTGAALMASGGAPDKGWDFLKWWTSAEVQGAYGRELESVMGPAARYNSANREAFDSVGWDRDIKEQLDRQREEARPIPETPGSYSLFRHFDFAFRDILYNGENVRVRLAEAVEDIDKELARKRAEYAKHESNG